MATRAIDWNTHEGFGVVSFHGRNIYVSVRGPPRSDGQPIIVCEAGHGSTSYVWAAVQSQASRFVRILAYDRAGMGQSEPGPGPRTAAVAAQELSDMLGAAGIAGPYVLVCHSYGGFIAREFLHIRHADVAGIVFVDVITERYSAENFLPAAEFSAVLAGLDFWDVCGMEQQHRLGPEEWELAKKQWLNDEATEAAEGSAFTTSEKELAAKKQFELGAMGDRPVVVIKGNATQDIKNVLDAGEDAGNGTQAQRAVLREFCRTSEAVREEHQRELLRLSSNSRYIVARHGFHSVQLSEPELVVAEIRALLGGLSS